MKNKLRHEPVLVDEVISYLKPQKNKLYFDGTFGQGGYSKKILKEYDCKIFAIDRDPESLKYATEKDDLSKVNDLLKVLKKPYERVSATSIYQSTPLPEENYVTYCGT